MAVSRSIGDEIAHSVGVTSEPDIKVVQLDRKRTQYIFIAATDGLWNVMSNSSVKTIAKTALLNSSQTCTPSFDLKNSAVTPYTLCHNLMDEALKKWENNVEHSQSKAIDDVTVLSVAYL